MINIYLYQHLIDSVSLENPNTDGIVLLKDTLNQEDMIMHAYMSIRIEPHIKKTARTIWRGGKISNFGWKLVGIRSSVCFKS